MVGSDRPVKRDGVPVQGVFDPVTGKDITGDFVADSRKAMKAELAKIYSEAETRKAGGEEPEAVYSELSIRVTNIVTDHFRSLKLPPDEGLVQIYRMHLAELLGVSYA